MTLKELQERQSWSLDMKKYNLGSVKMTMETNGFPKGVILKRELTVREARYILYTLLGINILTREDCDDADHYKEENETYRDFVTRWLRGEMDDEAIADFAYDCSDEQLGLKNMIPIVAYLKKKDIID